MILEQIMKKNNISKAQLARDLDISQAYISMIFKDQRRLSMNLLQKIRKKYNLPWNTIMEEK
tara:strand:+ start:12907 stop:13092 length:186 start_codon:yes stop_codon:yes gene_type:complete